MGNTLTKPFIMAQVHSVLDQNNDEAQAARLLAILLFRRIKDRNLKNYYTHLHFVASPDPDFQPIGFLHDLFEKFPEWTVEDLKWMGFSDFTIEGVRTLNRYPREKYFDHIVRIGTTVYPPWKKRDWIHNSDPGRKEPAGSPKHAEYDRRMIKYRLSYFYFQDIERGYIEPGMPFANWILMSADNHDYQDLGEPGKIILPWDVEKLKNESLDLVREFSDQWIPTASWKKRLQHCQPA